MYIHSATPIARTTPTMTISMMGLRVVRFIVRVSSRSSIPASLGPKGPRAIDAQGLNSILLVQDGVTGTCVPVKTNSLSARGGCWCDHAWSWDHVWLHGRTPRAK